MYVPVVYVPLSRNGISLVNMGRRLFYGGGTRMVCWVAVGNRAVIVELRHAPFPRWASLTAAQSGYLEILLWAHKNGFSWDEETMTCSTAALSGHLEVLAHIPSALQ